MEKSANKKPIKTGFITIIFGIFTILIVIAAIFVGLYTYRNKTKETKDYKTINNEYVANKNYMYNIIPNFTYECLGNPHLYLNILYNDDSMDVYGFGYTADGRPIKELELNLHFKMNTADENQYYCEDYYIMIKDDYLTMYDWRANEEYYSFEGDFFLTQDIIELKYDDVLGFFRDTNNIGKMFKCNLIYHDYKSDEYGDFYRLQFLDEYGYILTVGFTVPDYNQRFFDGDIVTVIGKYTPYYNNYVDVMVEGRNIEFCTR